MIRVNKHQRIPHFLTLSCCLIACLSCSILQRKFALSSVLSSALIGFAASFIPTHSSYDHKRLAASSYTGSFAAMTSLNHHSTFLDGGLLGIKTGLLFLLFGHYMRGFGGKLGSIAFASCLIFIGSRYALDLL